MADFKTANSVRADNELSVFAMKNGGSLVENTHTDMLLKRDLARVDRMVNRVVSEHRAADEYARRQERMDLMREAKRRLADRPRIKGGDAAGAEARLMAMLGLP